MPVSKIDSRGRTTVPKEVRKSLGTEPGDTIRWELEGSTVRILTFKNSPLAKWKGFVKGGPDNAVKAVALARRLRGRVE